MTLILLAICALEEASVFAVADAATDSFMRQAITSSQMVITYGEIQLPSTSTALAEEKPPVPVSQLST